MRLMMLYRRQLPAAQANRSEVPGPFHCSPPLIHPVDRRGLERLLQARAQTRAARIVAQDGLPPPLAIVHVVAVQCDHGRRSRSSRAVGESQRRTQSSARSIALVLDPRETFLLQRELDPAVPQQRGRRVVPVMHAQNDAHVRTPFSGCSDSGCSIIGAIVIVVVVAFAQIAVHFVEHQANGLGANAVERREHGRDGLARGPPGARHHQHAVHRRGHLQRLGETQQRRRVDNHQVIARPPLPRASPSGRARSGRPSGARAPRPAARASAAGFPPEATPRASGILPAARWRALPLRES